MIGPYVHIGAGSRITDSTIGPHVSLAEAAEVVGSTVRDSVAERGVRVVDATVTGSLLGAHNVVRGVSGRLDLGDPSAVGSAEWSEPA